MMKASGVCIPAVLCALMMGSGAGVTQKSAGDTMTLDVVVTDKTDKPVADLKAEDFKVLDNKEEQPISSVRLVTGGGDKTDPPVTVYLVVDEVNSVYEDTSTKQVIGEYLRQAGAQLALPTSLILFSGANVSFQRQPTLDPKILMANLAGVSGANHSVLPLRGGSGRAADLWRTSLEGLNHIAMKLNEVKGRKLVIWISPGWPRGGPLLHGPNEGFEAIFSYNVGVSTALRQARITIFSVDPHGADPIFRSDLNTSYKNYLKGQENWKRFDSNSLILQVIAAQTGGLVLFGSNDFARMIGQCVSDADAFYEVTYSAPHARQANEYHAVEVTVDKPGLTTRERMGYYAQP
jgi:VWFA-related protein